MAWFVHEDFTDQERAAVRFALKFGTDHLSVDDADRAALRAHFDDRQIVELGLGNVETKRFNGHRDYLASES